MGFINLFVLDALLAPMYQIGVAMVHIFKIGVPKGPFSSISPYILRTIFCVVEKDDVPVKVHELQALTFFLATNLAMVGLPSFFGSLPQLRKPDEDP